MKMAKMIKKMLFDINVIVYHRYSILGFNILNYILFLDLVFTFSIL